MQQSGSQGVGRTILTVVGIVLLVIFGVRAASQASSLAAVGGPAKRFASPFQSINQLTEVATTSARPWGNYAPYTQVVTTQPGQTTAAAPSLSAKKDTIAKQAKKQLAQSAKQAEKRLASGSQTVALSLSNDQTTTTAQTAGPKQQHVK